MKVRCTSMVDKEVWDKANDTMNWLAGKLEPALRDKEFGSGVQQFMVLAVAFNERLSDDEAIVRSNTKYGQFKDPFTGKKVQQLSVALPIGFERMRAFDQHNLRRFVAESLIARLEHLSSQVPKSFDYEDFMRQMRHNLGSKS